jgi:hypothetical protein
MMDDDILKASGGMNMYNIETLQIVPCRGDDAGREKEPAEC